LPDSRSFRALRFRAGPTARRLIQEGGFSAGQIGSIAGASGGAKWLVLSQLDRVIARRILPKLTEPVHLIGTSIGAWRFTCYAQQDPVAAIERFEEAYLEQRYSKNPDIHEISAKSREILEWVLGAHGIEEVLTHPVLRMHVMTVRARSIAASEHRVLLGLALIIAAMANTVSRRTLGALFSRSLFYDPRTLPPFFGLAGMPIERTPLNAANFLPSVLATGAIPLVLSGVRDIAGAPPGMYRDGGIIDYHLDFPASAEGRITLYPHFYDHLIPGWFDKRLKWRRPAPASIERTLLLCPSDEFVARLPNRKIPDRHDFGTMSPDRRRKVWREVVVACEALADELNAALDTGDLASRLEPL
jgi:hypothetical protein